MSKERVDFSRVSEALQSQVGFRIAYCCGKCKNYKSSQDDKGKAINYCSLLNALTAATNTCKQHNFIEGNGEVY